MRKNIRKINHGVTAGVLSSHGFCYNRELWISVCLLNTVFDEISFIIRHCSFIENPAFERKK